MIEVELYCSKDDKCPVKEYLESLEPKLYAKTLRTIDLLMNSGTELRMPFSECLGDGLFELRTIHGSDVTRVLYFFYVGNKAILTNGFTKKNKEDSFKTAKISKEISR